VFKRSAFEKLESSICVFKFHEACKSITAQVVHADSLVQGAHQVHIKW